MNLEENKTVALHNLGCKVNAYELEAMQEKLEDAGFTIVPFAPGADIYIINTCTVTNIADKKSRQMLHKAKKMNPLAQVVAVGCYVDTNEDEITKDDAIDIIVKNSEKKDIVTILQHIDRSMETSDNRLYLSRKTDHTRAYIKVQDGCNQFCSYCIIPFARGRVQSRSLDEVVQEVRELANVGYKEIVLTGIHLSSYGLDHTERDESLLTLIQAIQKVDGIARIRLGSLEPRIIEEPFVKALSKLDKLCPHFHLSLQSGCDTTLKRMNRHYSAMEYKKSCELLRNYFDHPALTTDVIVGFPMESEEEFVQSYDFVKDINFYETHIFKYSRRKGTKADQMEGQIPEQVKHERSKQLIALGEKHKEDYMRTFIGQKVEVLLEETMEIDGKWYDVGHTMEYVKVAVPGSEKNRKNELITVIPDKISPLGCLVC